MAMCCAEMHPYQTHSSPLEAAEAGTQTVGHSPQRCRPFRVSPPTPLSVWQLQVRSIGESVFAVNEKAKPDRGDYHKDTFPDLAFAYSGSSVLRRFGFPITRF